MTFNQTPSNFTNSSDANFRAWGSNLAAQLLAAGLVKTSDTGQIDWATVTTPAGINTYQGYEIWRLNDTLQATAPVYIKIQYGEGSAVDGPGIRVQFGTGSNGSGTLTGNVSTARDAEGNAQAGACIVVGSGDSSRFCFAGGWTAGSGLGLCFTFERTKDALGADTALGMMWSAHSTGNASNTAAVNESTLWNPSVGDYGLVETNFMSLFPTGSTMKTVSLGMVAPVFHNIGVFINPQLGFVGVYTNDYAVSSTFVANMYGSSHTYYVLASTACATGAGFQGPGGGTETIAIRYE